VTTQTDRKGVIVSLAEMRRPKPKRKPPVGRRRAAWGKSRYRGVYATPYGRWHVQIRVGGRLYDGGTYRDEAVAAGAYNVLAVELLGDKARLNVIEGR